MISRVSRTRQRSFVRPSGNLDTPQNISPQTKCLHDSTSSSGRYGSIPCEYWNATQQRWVLVDAQLDEFQCDALHVPFDPLDVPRDQFIVGGKAWQLCRSEMADPDAFGIFDMHGLWFVRGDFVRDVAALNKVELLPWDGWGIIEAQDEHLTEDDLAFLDHVASLTCADVPEFARVRRLYESDARLTVPPTFPS